MLPARKVVLTVGLLRTCLRGEGAGSMRILFISAP